MIVDLKNKTALVTGAGRGIGKAIALKLASCGAKVICISKSDTCAQVADTIKAQGGEAFAYPVDLGDSSAVKAALESILQTHPKVDILVNNAGITRDNLLLRMKPEEWDSVIATNLSSAFHITQALIQPMARARWGRVINIASIVGLMGNAGQVNYAAAKAGLIGFTKSLAKEFASRTLTANVVAPGWTDTDMTQQLNETIQQEVLKHIPLKRMGKPEEVADLVAFLASDNAAYITGQTFAIDGGLTMH
jgi:3-oxoacyl-[acyl-carrier protein] reductase